MVGKAPEKTTRMTCKMTEPLTGHLTTLVPQVMFIGKWERNEICTNTDKLKISIIKPESLKVCWDIDSRWVQLKEHFLISTKAK